MQSHHFLHLPSDVTCTRLSPNFESPFTCFVILVFWQCHSDCSFFIPVVCCDIGSPCFPKHCFHEACTKRQIATKWNTTDYILLPLLIQISWESVTWAQKGAENWWTVGWSSGRWANGRECKAAKSECYSCLIECLHQINWGGWWDVL